MIKKLCLSFLLNSAVIFSSESLNDIIEENKTYAIIKKKMINISTQIEKANKDYSLIVPCLENIYTAFKMGLVTESQAQNQIIHLLEAANTHEDDNFRAALGIPGFFLGCFFFSIPNYHSLALTLGGSLLMYTSACAICKSIGTPFKSKRDQIKNDLNAMYEALSLKSDESFDKKLELVRDVNRLAESVHHLHSMIDRIINNKAMDNISKVSLLSLTHQKTNENLQHEYSNACVATDLSLLGAGYYFYRGVKNSVAAPSFQSIYTFKGITQRFFDNRSKIALFITIGAAASAKYLWDQYSKDKAYTYATYKTHGIDVNNFYDNQSKIPQSITISATASAKYLWGQYNSKDKAYRDAIYKEHGVDVNNFYD